MFTLGGPASTVTVVAGGTVVVGAAVVDGATVVEVAGSTVVEGASVVEGRTVDVDVAGSEHATARATNMTRTHLLILRTTVSLDVVRRYGAVRQVFPNRTDENSPGG